MIITDIDKLNWKGVSDKDAAFCRWLNSAIFNDLGGDGLSASVSDYIRVGHSIVKEVSELLNGHVWEIERIYGEAGRKVIMDNMNRFLVVNGSSSEPTAWYLVESLAQQMNDKSEHKTNKTVVLSKGAVNPETKIGADGTVETTASGINLEGDKDTSETFGSGLGTIAIVAGLVLVLILLLKRK